MALLRYSNGRLVEVDDHWIDGNESLGGEWASKGYARQSCEPDPAYKGYCTLCERQFDVIASHYVAVHSNCESDPRLDLCRFCGRKFLPGGWRDKHEAGCRRRPCGGDQ